MKKLITALLFLVLLAMPVTPAKAGVIGIEDEMLINPMDVVKSVLAKKGYTMRDWYLLASAMQLENGCNSDLCLQYTGSVILNRTKASWCPDTIEGVLLQKGQYAEHTVKNLYTTKVTERIQVLALGLLLHGSLDEELIFQSMHPYLGKVKYVIDGEYFATAK